MQLGMAMVNVLNFLINSEANVNIQNTECFTALMYAASHGHDKCLEVLIKSGADVNTQNKYGLHSTDVCCIP